MDFTDLVTKYQALLLDNLQVFILVFALGCTLVWFIVHARVGNAKSEVEAKKAELEVLQRHVNMNREHAEHYRERAEHYKARIEALEVQNLRTYTPPGFEKKSKN